MKRKEDKMERGWEGTASRLHSEFFNNFDSARGPSLSSKLRQYPMNTLRVFSKDNYLMKITPKGTSCPVRLSRTPIYRPSVFSLSLSLSPMPFTEDSKNRQIPSGASSVLQSGGVALYVLQVLCPLCLSLQESSMGHWPLRLRGVRGTHQRERSCEREGERN